MPLASRSLLTAAASLAAVAVGCTRTADVSPPAALVAPLEVSDPERIERSAESRDNAFSQATDRIAASEPITVTARRVTSTSTSPADGDLRARLRQATETLAEAEGDLAAARAALERATDAEVRLATAQVRQSQARVTEARQTLRELDARLEAEPQPPASSAGPPDRD